MTQAELKLHQLHVSAGGTPILKGVSLDIKGGEVHAIMGPNGTGKSTLSLALMGHPRYEVTGGSAMLNGQDLLAMAVDERARAGLFLAMQYPSEIAGVSNANFLRTAVNARQPDGKEVGVLPFRKQLEAEMASLGIESKFADRYLNEGFSGGEKKRNEILQLAMLKPRIAILDEIDSGLDIDALKVVAQAVNALRSPQMGVLIITHYQRLLEYIAPDHVHVLIGGRIVKSGGKELAQELEAKGYDWLKPQDAADPQGGGAP